MARGRGSIPSLSISPTSAVCLPPTVREGRPGDTQPTVLKSESLEEWPGFGGERNGQHGKGSLWRCAESLTVPRRWEEHRASLKT